MSNLKYRLGLALLSIYGVVGAVALASQWDPAMDAPSLLASCLETVTASASSGEGGGSNWQAFLPGMLK